MPSDHTAHVFIDTNIPLHFQRPDQIDWCNLTGSHTVNLVAAPILLRELERQKVHNPSRILRERAGAFVKWLDGFMEDPEKTVLAGVQWLFLPHEPQIDFAVHNLSRDISDDHLIASVLDYMAGLGDPVYVATGDIGVKGKLKFRQIDVLWLPDSLRRPTELDPIEQENKTLRAENTKLKNRIPKLSVTFPDGAPFQEVCIEGRRDLGVPSLEEIKRGHPLAKPAEDSAAALILQSAPMVAGWARWQKLLAISADRVKDYDEALNNYYGGYEKYLRDLENYQEQRRLSVQIGVVIANTGTAPATCIRLTLTFPEDVKVATVDDAPQEPSAPKPPPRPTPGDDILGVNLFHGMSLAGLKTGNAAHRLGSMRIPHEGDANIASDGQSVRFRLGRLQHGAREPLEAFVMRFIGQQNVGSFSIQYRISADEIPEPITGEIHIRVRGDDK
jgi:hypothetical protein